MSETGTEIEIEAERHRELAICRSISIVQGYDGTMTKEEILDSWQFLVNFNADRECGGWLETTAQDLINAGIIKRPT